MSTQQHPAPRSPRTYARETGTGPEPIAEIADLLAAAVIRLLARQSSQLSSVTGESSVDFTPDQSVHADVLTGSGDQG
jgi:hypothetical protein